MADELLPGLDAQFLPREQREETIAVTPSRVLLVERDKVQFALLHDGLLEELSPLSFADALVLLQIERAELQQGWYNIDTQEFLGANLPNDFFEAQ